MRDKLLRIIKKAGKFSVDDLAIITGIDEEVVKTCISEFIKEGCVKKTVTNAYIYRQLKPDEQVKPKKRKDFDYYKTDDADVFQYLQCSEWAQKRYNKYMELIEKTNGLIGKALCEFIENWNKKHPQDKTTYSCVQKIRAKYRIYGPVALIPRVGRYIQIDMKKEWFERFVDVYLSRGRLGVDECRKIIIDELIAENPDFDPLSFPSVASFDRMLHSRFTKQEIKRLKYYKRQKKSKSQYILNNEELKKLLATAKQYYPTFYPILVIAITTGLSRSEILGLTWEGVNYKKGTIFVRVNKKIEVSKKIIDFLKTWKRQSSNLKSKYVFCNTIGNKQDPSSLIKMYFIPLIKKAGIPKIKFSELTDIYAGFMLSQNVPITFLKEQLGDKTLDLTYSKYGHLVPEFNKDKINYNDLGI